MEREDERKKVNMTLKPRWVHPLNFREQDKQLLDASLDTAEREHTDFTNLIRRALQEYVALHSRKAIPRLDEYIKDPTFEALPPITKLLTPKELEEWSDENLLLVAKYVRSRRMELDCELEEGVPGVSLVEERPCQQLGLRSLQVGLHWRLTAAEKAVLLLVTKSFLPRVNSKRASASDT
jgi:hypothetical protein